MSETKNAERKMKNEGLEKLVTGGVAIILALVPFQAFLTVWAASLTGHYTAWRLWEEFLLIPLVIGAVWLVLSKRELRYKLSESWLIRLMFVYVLLQFFLGFVALHLHQVTRTALAEGLIEDTRFMVFFFVAWAAAARSSWLRAHWKKLLLIPAAIVIVFGLLQAFILPANFLAHFGYSPATIPPFQLVDLNSGFVRVQSTLRGPNPLGAYLVVVIAAIVAMVGFRVKSLGLQAPLRSSFSVLRSQRLALAFGLATLIVLYFTYSRSAYLGAALVIFSFVWIGLKTKRARLWLLAASVLVCVLAGGSALLLRHNASFEDTFFHTSQLSHSPKSSNYNRASALERSLRNVAREPFGRGPGTAGPASEHNNHLVRISENYFLQIGQETGWLGLALFIVINFLLAKELWKRRDQPDHLPQILLVGLIGLTAVNLLSLAWTDDTLAYIWWGLAGIALADILQTKVEHKHGKQTAAKAQTPS